MEVLGEVLHNLAVLHTEADLLAADTALGGDLGVLAEGEGRADGVDGAHGGKFPAILQPHLMAGGQGGDRVDEVDIPLLIHHHTVLLLQGGGDAGEILLPGELQPLQCRVSVGFQVSKPGPDRAFMFQNYALFPWMKVGENIMYPMKKQKLPKEQRLEKLYQLLDMAQLGDYENYYIHELSGGMRQRVALLRAMACDPKVLLMDEPLGAVDFQMRQLLQVQLEQMLQQKRTTSLMVTHDVDEAVYLSDRIIVMSRDYGRILSDLHIDLPRPRDRTHVMYHNYVDQLTNILKSALNGDVKNDENKDLLEFIQKAELEKSRLSNALFPKK